MFILLLLTGNGAFSHKACSKCPKGYCPDGCPELKCVGDIQRSARPGASEESSTAEMNIWFIFILW